MGKKKIEENKLTKDDIGFILFLLGSGVAFSMFIEPIRVVFGVIGSTFAIVGLFVLLRGG